jgi:hypothetical protein
VQYGLSMNPLDHPEGVPGPQRTPGAFVAAPATIFVSATFFYYYEKINLV